MAPKAADSDDGTDIDGFSAAWFGNAATANAYDYGLLPEVKVRKDGKTSVVKHRALGRFARELADVQPDGRTVYMGDDGAYTGLFLFVADEKGELSEGTLYAGKWTQTSDLSGGAATLSWIRLGHAEDEELQALVDGGIGFADMFDVSNVDPVDPTYKKVKTYTGTEWLRVKPGMEKAAAFLETRRYAALLGATTEFAKMEGISHNEADGKAYVVISRIEGGMLASATDPQDDVRLPRNDGGAIYELALAAGQRDTGGRPIPSRLVATTMASIPELLGGWLGGTRDAEGNRCLQDKVCGPDNIKFSEGMRTLFVGEDTSRRNNNYVWAFNVDTRKLSRILSVPMYAEATGLQVVDDANGFSYLMSNFQHPAEQSQIGAFKGVKDATGAVILSEADVLTPSAPGGAGARRPPSATSARRTGRFRPSGRGPAVPHSRDASPPGPGRGGFPVLQTSPERPAGATLGRQDPPLPMNPEAAMKTVQMKSIFQVGRHVLQVFGNQGRWVVAVDGVLLRGWHSTSADAWSAGVAEVDRLGTMSPAAEPAQAMAAGRK